MKIRASAPEKDLENLVELLKANYTVVGVSKPYADGEDVRFKKIYIDILADQTKITTIGEYEVIDYCNQWRSKADVMHTFYISFEAAEEILNRLVDSGALVEYLVDKRYEYIDSRYQQFVGKFCGRCQYRSGFGECTRGVVFDDLNDNHIPVKHPACVKFKPDYSAIWSVATPENYEKIKEGENE